MENKLRKTLNRAEKLYQKDKKYFAYYADILINAGEISKAKQVLKNSINMFRDYTTGEIVLGELFLNENKFDQAEMLFTGAVHKNLSCVIAYKKLAEIYDKKKMPDKKLEMLRQVLRYDPMDTDAINFILMNESESVFGGTNAPFEEKQIKESEAETVQAEPAEPLIITSPAGADEEVLHKLDSSADIDIPEFGFEEKDEVVKKHNLTEEALNRERSFSEDIVESLDGLTQSFIEERNAFTAFVDERKELSEEEVPEVETDQQASATDETPSEEVHVSVAAAELNLNYKDSDPKIEALLSDLVLSPEIYKEKMETLSKLVDEDPNNYDKLVDFAHARYKFAAATVKREIQYYSKKTGEEPKNPKYIQNLKSYRDEILKLNLDLKEELNVLKNEYY